MTWNKYNKESLNKWQDSPYLEDLCYDSENDKLYVAWGWTQLSVITNNGSTITNLTGNIPKMLQFDGAPTKEQIGSNYCERRIRTVSIDPNNPDIIYAGGSSYTYQGDSSIYRSCDGGSTWKVVSINGTNSIVSTNDGDYGGVEPTCINVKPDTGELWASGNCTGLSKLTPPYKQNSIKDNTVQTTSQLGIKSATINYFQDSSFTVTVPKSIVLDSSKTTTYNINVKGDINGNETIIVQPDTNIVMSDANGKPDVLATVAQEKTDFTVSDVMANSGEGTSTTGNISADLTAGNWSGVLNFTISIK